MYLIIKFFCKWIIPIGFVKIIVKKYDIFPKDSVGKQIYYRLSDNEKLNGADILIRKN